MTEYNKIKYDNQECAVEYAVNAGTQNSATSQATQTTQGTCSGNQATATKLQTARNINIQDADGTNTGTQASFNGTQAATIKLPATIKASITGNCSGSAGSVAWGNVTGKPTFATVATSGSYNDLSNKPAIPSVDKCLQFSTDSWNNGSLGSWGVVTPANGYNYVFSVVSNPDGGCIEAGLKGGQTSLKIDGLYYQDEGNNMVIDVRHRHHFIFDWGGNITGSTYINFGDEPYYCRDQCYISFAIGHNNDMAQWQWFTAPYNIGKSFFTGIDTNRFWNNSVPYLFAWRISWGIGTGNQEVNVWSKHCYITSDGNTNWSDSTYESIRRIRIWGNA